MNYVVQKGDTLSSIASRYGLSWQQLQSANGLSNPNLIYVGQSVNIPSGGGASQDKVPDPNVYKINWQKVDLSPEHIKSLEDSAYNELAPYYQKLLDDANGDVEIAKKRMQEDYDRGNRIKTEDVATAIKYATEDTGVGHQANAEKLKYAQDTLKYLDTTKFPVARQALLGTYNARGLFNSGLKDVGMDQLGQSQALEREGQVGSINDINRSDQALDTNLKRTEEQQNLDLTRTQEQLGLTKTRGTEDATRALQKQKDQWEQERRMSAISIAQSKLDRQIQSANISNNYGNG